MLPLLGTGSIYRVNKIIFLFNTIIYIEIVAFINIESYFYINKELLGYILRNKEVGYCTQDVVAGSFQKKVQTMYQQRE